MTHIISPQKSDFLNLIRWIAALLVVFGHVDLYLGIFACGEPLTGPAFGYLGHHSHAAVIVFFVLSGYVLTYATEKKCVKGDYGFRDYFLDRWSRIYSVLFAAIALTLILDLIGTRISSVYLNPAFLPQQDFMLRLMTNLFGLQGIWGHRIQLGSNPALWSIGYEFTYYMLFGLLFFKKHLFHSRWTAPLMVTLILGLIGWKMAVYFLVWLMGSLAYYISRSGLVAGLSLCSWLLLFMLVAINHTLVSVNILGLTEIFQDLLFAGIIATILCFDVKQIPPFISKGSRINSYMADFSYSLYAFHMPIILFLCSIFSSLLKEIQPPFFLGLMLTLACLILTRGLYHLTEARRKSFRQLADSVIIYAGDSLKAMKKYLVQKEKGQK